MCVEDLLRCAKEGFGPTSWSELFAQIKVGEMNVPLWIYNVVVQIKIIKYTRVHLYAVMGGVTK